MDSILERTSYIKYKLGLYNERKEFPAQLIYRKLREPLVFTTLHTHGQKNIAMRSMLPSSLYYSHKLYIYAKAPLSTAYGPYTSTVYT